MLKYLVRSNHEEITYIDSRGDIVLDPTETEAPSQSCKDIPGTGGLPKGLDAMFVSSGPGNQAREKLLRSNLQRHGINSFEIRTEWDFKRVATEMASLSWIFSSAGSHDLPANTIARHNTGHADFEWENPTATQQHTLVNAVLGCSCQFVLMH